MEQEIKEKVIFVVSNEPWGKQWFIKHHYANELAKLGYLVYFINPVDEWRPGNLIKRGIEVTALRENLKLVEYKNFLPVRGFPKLALRLNDWINSKKLRKLSGKNAIIIWQFDPFRFSFNYFANSKKIYHIADPYQDSPFDRENIRQADLLVCTSKMFLPYYSSFGKKTIYIPHGVSDEEFETSELRVRSLRKDYGDYILHAGSINDRLDIKIFREILDRFESRNLVLIGPNLLESEETKRTFSECLTRKNFRYLGTVDGNDVKNYVRASKVCLIAYKFNTQETLGPPSSSLKVLNYIAQRKPTISSLELEYEQLDGNAVLYASNLSKYLDLTSEALEGQVMPDPGPLKDFLAKRRYDIFARKILAAIEGP